MTGQLSFFGSRRQRGRRPPLLWLAAALLTWLFLAILIWGLP